jgi:hypothetical protein
MESQQMLELLLKEIRAGQEENRINQEKMEADRKADVREGTPQKTREEQQDTA